MKRYWKVTALLGLLVVSVVACATMQSSWRRTVSANSIAAYEGFLSRYPESDSCATAKVRLESLRFRDAVLKDEIARYDKFAEDFPKSEFASDLGSRRDRRAAELKRARTRKLVLERRHDRLGIDSAFYSRVRNCLTDMGFEVVTRGTDYDAKLVFGPLNGFLPSGTWAFNLSPGSSTLTPTRLGCVVTVSLSHRAFGAVFAKDIQSDVTDYGEVHARELSLLECVLDELPGFLEEYLGKP